jgi:hypothetical protein
MTMLTLLLAAYGVAFGLMNDKAKALTSLAKRLPLFRDEDGDNLFARMFGCAYCTGFHTGWLVWCVAVLPEHVAAGTLEPSLVGGVVSFAFASSAFCYGMDTALQWLER